MLLASLALASSACQRDPTAAPQPVSDKAVPESRATRPGEAGTQPVIRWACDGGATITTKYLPRDRAISLGVHEGERKLPKVASASGEKYQDGPITFWRQGGTATYERAPAPPIGCRLTDV